MQLSEFTLRIILLFIPGIISFIIIDKLTVHKEAKIHTILINSLLLGFTSYFSYYLIINTINILKKEDINFLFLKALTNPTGNINFREIVFVTLIAIIIGFIFTYAINYKILHKFAAMIKASNKFGDMDVWSYIMNSKDKIDWIVIRDIEHDLMYEGRIEVFSDSTEIDELFLSDVIVYKNTTGEELYRIPGLYLPRKREKLTIEFPSLKFSPAIERSNKEEDSKNDK